MSKIEVSKPTKISKGSITLSGSKSISNRVLIIRALTKGHFDIYNLSDSDDTNTLQSLLDSSSSILDAHHAGTTFRFMTAYLALKEGVQELTGSDRMQERPIGALVDALVSMGANITYTQKEGYPPLSIGSPSSSFSDTVNLPADISSQYISALLLIAPTLPNGITINLIGDIVSRPYLEMTLRIMEYFGVQHIWNGSSIIIKPQEYIAKDFFVEADWSAASYYYIIAALSDEADITLYGLKEKSLQGDQAISKIAESFGVSTEFSDEQIRLRKTGTPIKIFEHDFINCPDIAQSVSTMSAGVGVQGLFSGLQTLKIKETDRIAALKNELAKVNVYLSALPSKFSQKSNVAYYMQEGMANNSKGTPTFDTYKDHRMAMCFAPLGILFPIAINNPMVVSKSYPSFWQHLEKIGFKIKKINDDG